MVLFGDFHSREETAVDFECRCQMIQRLFEIAMFQICLAQFGIGCHQYEQIFLVDVHEQFWKSQLLNAYLNNARCILSHRKLIQLFVSFSYKKKEKKLQNTNLGILQMQNNTY